MSLQEQFEIRAFGPCRVIGMNSKGKPQDNQIPQLWASVCARVRGTELEEPGFGVCRCVPEARDGSFEYVAAFSARENAKIPAGMMAIEIPRSDYAVLTVPGIPEVGNVSRSATGNIDASMQWDRYRCGPEGCTCLSHPAFEFYPPGYRGSEQFFIYLPIKAKNPADKR